jgi:hypothetical protein
LFKYFNILYYKNRVFKAEKIFRKICPTEEFLPRPPEPEDIIIETAPMSNTDESDDAKKEATEEEQETETAKANDSATSNDEPEPKEPKLDDKETN